MIKLHLRGKVFLFALVILLFDQAAKLWVKTHMTLGQEHALGNWCYILFTENPGMAFGYTFGYGVESKLTLTFLRLLVCGGIAWLIYVLCNRKIPTGLLMALSAIMAGALGNIVDSTFYGMLFSDSLGRVAEFLPAEGGYGEILCGHVVDMLYFPIINTQYPPWIPIIGGDELLIFRPIFNIADVAISAGIFYIMIFQRKNLHVLFEEVWRKVKSEKRKVE